MPNANVNGPDSFTYHAYDGITPSNIVTVSITVTAVNDTPTFTAGGDQTVAEDSGAASVSWASGISAGPADESGQALDFIVSNDNNGLFSVQPAIAVDGTLTFTPAADANGVANVTVSLHDDGGGLDTSGEATFKITVTQVNDTPTADDDTATTAEDTPANAIDVLTGDSAGPNEAGQTLTVEIIDDPDHGTAEVNGNGTIKYTPAPDSFGADELTYRICDDGVTGITADPLCSATATLTITVTSVNDAPIADADSASTTEDVATDPIDVLDGDVAGPDNESTQLLDVTIVDDPDNGSASVNGDGKITYTPAADYNGSDQLTYQVCDNETPFPCDTATLSITVTQVNDAPTGVADVLVIDEDAGPTIVDVLANDSKGPPNESGQTLTVTNVVQPLHGVVINNGNNVTYTPTADYNGTDAFTYIVCDNGKDGLADAPRCSAVIAMVSVTINSVNDVPVVAGDSATVDEDDVYDSGTASVLENDSDSHGGAQNEDNPLEAVMGVDPIHGEVDLDADGTFTYTPADDYFGPDSFTYYAKDSLDGLSLPATVSITVSPVNDAPIADADSATTAEDTAKEAIDVLDGDVAGPTNENTQGLTVSIIDAPDHGTATVDVTDGTIDYVPDLDFNGLDTLTYKVCDDGTPSECDTAILTITVTSVNDAPVVAADSATVAEDGSFDSGDTSLLDSGDASVLANDSDDHDGAPDEDDPFTAAVATDVLHGTLVLASDGTFTYVPAPDFNGTDSFTYTATDVDGGESLEATVTIHVTSVNDVPVVTDDSASVAEDGHLNGTSVLGNDSDLHGFAPSEDNPMTAVIGTTTTHGALNLDPTGTYTYDPALDFNGTDSFTYRAKDSHDGLSALATVTITVTSVNDAPVAVGDSGLVAEDESLNGTSVLANDSDSHGGAPNEGIGELTAELGTTVTHGTLLLALDGTFTYTPAANYNGSDSFTYRAKDSIGDLGNEVTVSITVTAVNDTPIALPDSYDVDEDDSRTFDVRTNDKAGPDNESGQTLTATIETNPTHGDLLDNGDGTFTYTPDPGYNGLDGFSYKLCDNGTTSGADNFKCTTVGATVDVTVDSVNDAPSGTDKTITILEDASHTFDAADFGFSDPDGDDLLSVQITNLPAPGTLTFNGSAASLPLVIDADDIDMLVFTPAADAHGLGYASFDFQVRDGGGTDNGGVDVDPSAKTITFDVTSVNDAPAGANATVTTNEDTPNAFDAADFGFTDPKDAPDDTFTGIVITNIVLGGGTLELDGNAVGGGDTVATGDIDDGKLVYTPAANANGPAIASFDFAVQDGGGDSDGGADLDASPNTIRIDVTAVNDVPSFTNGGNQTVNEDSGSATVAGWATPISTGPSDESGQTVAFTVTNDDNALFIGQPAIAPNGTLTFTPAANAHGSATVTVSVKDNGGGVHDTSADQTFTITVRSVNDAPEGTDNTVQTDENTPYVFTADDFGFSDLDGNDLEAVRITTIPAVGDGELKLDGNAVSDGNVVQVGDIALGLLVFTPDADEFGEPYATFTFQVRDDGGTAFGGADLDPSANTMSINVGSINDAPSGTNEHDHHR